MLGPLGWPLSPQEQFLLFPWLVKCVWLRPIREAGYIPKKRTLKTARKTQACPPLESLGCLVSSIPSPQVSRHLSKLFDSLCQLKFRLDADGRPVRLGLGMYDKGDEYVDFDQECDLSGPVSVTQVAERRDRGPPPG